MTDSKLQRLRTLTRVLDELIPIPGTRLRLGLDSVIGLIPGGGDAVMGVVAAYALIVGARVGAPPAVLATIAGNVLTDVVLGAVPLVGDLIDVGWKANRRNLRLLESYLADPQRVHARSRALLWIVTAGLAAIVLGTAAFAVWLAGWALSLLH